MNAVISGAMTVLILGIAVYSIHREPRRILNGFLLQIGVVMIYVTMLMHTVEMKRQFVLELYIALGLFFAIFILGIALMLDFAFVIKREGLSIAHVLPFFFGVLSVVVAYVGYLNLTSGLAGSYLYVTILSILQNIVLFLPFAIGSVLIYSIVYLFLPKKKDVQYIVVLGCGLRKNGEVTPLLRGRLDRAIKAYHRSKEKAKFVTSGGQGKDEIISESQAMKNYLLSKGIREDQIIQEARSVNTRENLLFSKAKIEEDGLGGNVLISTSNYHVLRAVILARALHFDAQGIGGHTALYYLPVAFIREYIAMIFQYKLLIMVYMLFAIISGVFV